MPMAAPMSSTMRPICERVAVDEVEAPPQGGAAVFDEPAEHDLQPEHEPEREAGADRALHEPLGHERDADEPVRRADELHDLDLAAAGVGGQADRVHDQEQRGREQDTRP